MTSRLAALVLLLLATVPGCTKVYNQPPTGPSTVATTPTPPPAPVADTIEFRVFGDVGNVPVLIRYTNSIDGVTALTASSLPYIVSIRSLESSIFLDLEARASPLIALTASLQVQIYVNGKLFREAFAAGISPLSVTASGTYRR